MTSVWPTSGANNRAVVKCSGLWWMRDYTWDSVTVIWQQYAYIINFPTVCWTFFVVLIRGEHEFKSVWCEAWELGMIISAVHSYCCTRPCSLPFIKCNKSYYPNSFPESNKPLYDDIGIIYFRLFWFASWCNSERWCFVWAYSTHFLLKPASNQWRKQCRQGTSVEASSISTMAILPWVPPSSVSMAAVEKLKNIMSVDEQQRVIWLTIDLSY